MAKRLFLFSLICLLASSCKEKKEASSFVSLQDVSGQIKVDELFDEFEYIPLETSDQSIFGGIAGLIVYDNHFFILDNTKMKKIYVFHDDGTYSHTIGTVGGGPEEYASIEDFTIDEENRQVVILAYPSTVYVYDLDGRFIRKKQLTSAAILWNIQSYKNGFVCSTNNRQSSTNSDDAFLIFAFDKDFNLKNKLFDALPNQVAIPPFICNPIQKNGDEIVYFDNFTSTMYSHITTSSAPGSVRFISDGDVPPDVYADPQNFFSNQGNYCFFLDALFVDDVLFAPFANKGSQSILVMNFKTGKKLVSHFERWCPPFLCYHGDSIYSFINPAWILDGNDMFSAKTTTKYPIEIDSNPVILRFKIAIDHLNL